MSHLQIRTKGCRIQSILIQVIMFNGMKMNKRNLNLFLRQVIFIQKCQVFLAI